MANLKNLPNEEIEKIVSGKLNTDKTVRLIESLRNANFKIETNKEEYLHYAGLTCPEALL